MRSRPLSEEEQRVINERNQEQEALRGAPKRFGITLTDLQKHGVTENCNGCKSAFTGRARQAHTRECRARFEDLLQEDEKVKASIKRENEFYARVTEADGKRSKKAEEDNNRAVAEALALANQIGGETTATLTQAEIDQLRAAELRAKQEAEEMALRNKLISGLTS